MSKWISSLVAIGMAALIPMTQVQASDVSLQSAITNLKYRLTVEWDQKNVKARNDIVSEFSAQVDALRAKGVSDEEIFKTLASNAFDAQTAKDIAQLAEYAKNKKLEGKDLHKLIADYANASQKVGTSWSPEATVGVIIAVVVIGVLIAIAASGGSVSVSTGYYYECWDECYYDDWGYVYCDTYCY